MTDNPYHNQHITDFTQCMEQAFNDNNNYNEQQYSGYSGRDEPAYYPPGRGSLQVETRTDKAAPGGSRGLCDKGFSEESARRHHEYVPVKNLPVGVARTAFSE